MMIDRAVARRSDPHTSHAAADSVTDLRENQRAVLSILRENRPGLTDERLIELYENAVEESRVPKQSPSGIRTRRKELVERGLVQDAGYTARMRTGRQGTVWEPVPDWQVQTNREASERRREQAVAVARQYGDEPGTDDLKDAYEFLQRIERFVKNFPPVGVAGDIQAMFTKWRQDRGE